MNVTEEVYFKNDTDLDNFLNEKQFRCVGSFLSWLKVGNLYTITNLHHSNYKIVDENGILGTTCMSQKQLLSCFVPVDIETDFSFALTYVWWLCENTKDRSYIESILSYYVKQNTESEKDNLMMEMRKKYYTYHDKSKNLIEVLDRIQREMAYGNPFVKLNGRKNNHDWYVYLETLNYLKDNGFTIKTIKKPNEGVALDYYFVYVVSWDKYEKDPCEVDY